MRIVIALLAFGLVFAVVGWPFFVAPAHDEPRAVDAVYVIGPPTDARMALAETMVADGLADTVVVSLSDSAEEREVLPEASRVCDEPQDYAVLCSQPEPFTTRGEARWMRDLVAAEGWESVAVITVTPHLTRTRVIMERCWNGDIVYIDSQETLMPWEWAHHYLYQSAAFVKVALEDGC
ncbi:hypothetical protein [Demequina mangrovi]|uniref:DUF218 domain-containing protein n=1 Tax=Demequina mangrovi TaxID=1043493 RepID=A0A1H6YIQ3_9MICO|nr:hypothetical protein [Demequina mangrovi]SEJ41169.1 hypothetical protein SAMN05421637_1764 [Demequina mangrovi]